MKGAPGRKYRVNWETRQLEPVPVPIFTYSAEKILTGSLVIVGVTSFIALAGLVVSPIQPPVIVFWVALGGYLGYGDIKAWYHGVRSALFCDGHVELTAKNLRRKVKYSEVEQLVKARQRVALSFKDHTIPLLSFQNMKNKKLRIDLYTWLVPKVPPESVSHTPLEPAKLEAKSLSSNLIELFLGRGAKRIAMLLAVQLLATAIISSLPFLPGEQAYFTQWQQQDATGFVGLSVLAEFEFYLSQ